MSFEQLKKQGRGSNPNSQKALSRQGKGRPLLKQEDKRQRRSLSFTNDGWNGLEATALAGNLSVSGFLELIGETSIVFTAPMKSIMGEEILSQLEMTPPQLMKLSVIDFLCAMGGMKKKKTTRKPKEPLLEGEKKAQHTLTLSTKGWEQIEQIASQQGRSIQVLLELIGSNYVVMLGSLYDLTSSAMLDRLKIMPAQLLDLSLIDILDRLSELKN